MKRILSLVLAMVMVLGSFSAVFAVEPTAADEAVETLMDLGVLTEGKLEQDLKRQDAIVLLSRLMGEEEEAKAFPSEDLAFVDVTDSFYKGYISWAVANELTKGKSETKFGFGEFLKTQELAMFLLRALGYGDVEFDNALTEATTLGLLVDVEEGVTAKRGMMAVMTLNALKTNSKGTEVTLATKLGHVLPEEEVVVPATLEVVSVTATNLKEVKVVFNQEVDEDTVVAANFVVKKGNATVATTPALLEDGMTVVLTAAPLTTGKLLNQSAYTLTVEKVKSVDGTEVAKTTEAFTAFDGTLPLVESMAYTGPKQIELTFSEPIELFGKITVKSGSSTISVNHASIDGQGTNVLQVPVFSTLVDKAVYTVTVSEFKDFAGYQNVIKTFEMEYVKDVTPPTAKVVSATQEYVVVEFNKPVTGITADHFSHTFTAWKALKLTADDVYASASINSGTKFYVWFNNAAASTDAEKAKNRPIEAGARNLNILAKVGSSEIQDLWSNKFAEVNLTFNVTADVTAPEVKEIKVTAEDKFTVEFNKNVTFTKDNVEVLDKDGKAIANLTLTVTGSAKKFTVTMSKELAGETLIINIKNVKDTTLLTNAMPTYSETILITDKTDPKIDKVTKDVVGEDTFLYVFFTEDMDAETTLVAGNYQLLNGTTFTKLTNTPEFINGNKTVKIKLTADEVKEINAGTTLFIDNVKDLAGNVIEVKVSATFLTHADAIKPVIDEVVATGTKTIEVHFNQELAEVNEDAFVIVNGGTIAGIDVALDDDGKTVVTISLNTAIADTKDIKNANNETITLNLVKEKVKNLFGVSNVAQLNITVDDAIAPSVAKDSEGKAKINAVEGKIVIEFTEELTPDAGLLVAQDLVVVKGTKTLVAGIGYRAVASGKTITIENVNGTALAEDDYKVSSKEAITYIKDTNNNKATKFTTVVKVEIKAPAVNKAALTAALATADAKVEAEYTAASWTAFSTDLAAAKLMPETTQAEVDTKLAAVEAAIAKLEVKPVHTVNLTAVKQMLNTDYTVSATSIVGATKYSITTLVAGTPIESEIKAIGETIAAATNATVTVKVYDNADALLHTFENVPTGVTP